MSAWCCTEGTGGAGRVLYERIIRVAFGELGFRSLIALLPHSRTSVDVLLRLGFRPDGEALLDGEPFRRYRLSAPKTVE